MDMIERLARAMSEVDRAEAGEAADFADWHWEEHRQHAAAVLEVLREPQHWKQAETSKGDRINRMMAWLENKIDKSLEQPHETDEAETTRKMSVLAHVYQLQQTSVRMERQRKLMEGVREEFDQTDEPKAH
jgi:hypothetical protein